MGYPGWWGGVEERAAADDLAPARCPCTHSLVMHWFPLGPPTSSGTAPSRTKTGLYGCAHYVNKAQQREATFLCIWSRYDICGIQVCVCV